MTFMARAIGFSGGLTDGSSAPPAMTYDVSKPVAAVTATINFNINGSVSTTVTAGGTKDIDTTHNWYNPTGTPPTRYLRVTPTVGSLTSNDLSSFTDMSVQRSITVNSASGGPAKSCTFTLEISSNSGGVPLLSSQTGNIIQADGT